jgi:2-keto-3-deoxy-L-rhamnonate aldolase RhmA
MAWKNVLKERTSAGLDTKALWVTIPWPPIMTMLAKAGIHAGLIDMEHTTINLNTVESLVIAAEAAGVAALVRPPSAESSVVTRLLDAGANGVVFPQIRCGSDAQLARNTVLYPPRGSRGWGGAHTRASGWQGAPAPLGVGTAVHPYTRDYLERAESQTSTVFLVESVEGVEKVDEILEAGRPDALIFGWGDYAVAVGFDRDRCEEAAQRVYEACRRNGVGLGLGPADRGRRPRYPGCFEIAGIDSLILSSGIERAAVDPEA